MNLSLQKYEAILATVQEIPPGKVATYGQIAALAGLPGRARMVGTALRKLPPDSGIPWHRVINAGGRISPRGDGSAMSEQELLLRSEGVILDQNGYIRLADFSWVL